MVSHFVCPDIHRISISDIEYQGIVSEKKVLKRNVLNAEYTFKILGNLLLTPHFIVTVISIATLLFLSLFNELESVHRYSVLFIIISLVVVLVVNTTMYLFQMKWFIKYIPDTSEQKYKITVNATDRIVEGRRLSCGDIINLKTGEDVPADIRIIKCKKLEVANSLFSNKEVEMNFRAFSTDEDVLKSNNMIFKGSTIIAGEMTGIVINPEESTIINNLLIKVKQIITSGNLSWKFSFTNQYIWLLTKFCIVGVLFIVTINVYLLLTGYIKWRQLVISIELISVLITESAFVMVMVSLLYLKGKFNNCVLSRSDLAISLGKVDIIFIRDISMFCQCKFIISKLWMDGNIIDGDQVVTSFEENQIKHSPTWTALSRASVLCNEANLNPADEDKPLIQRECDPEIECNDVDQSLLLAFNGCESVKKWGGSLSKYKQNNRSLIGPMYDSISNCKLSIHRLNDGDHRLLMVLQGNPVDILNCCRTVIIDGKEQNLESTWKDIILKSYNELGANNNIVRAFCDQRISPEVLSVDIKELTLVQCNTIPRQGLRFIGMLSFARSLKPSINQVFSKCMDLGVNLTFLDPGCGMYMLPKCKKIDSADINLMDDNSLDAVLYNNSIVSMADDTLALQLIKCSRDRGLVTAFVAKGVDDIATMISTNIGIVSSVDSCNLCKQLSDVCIIDDDFHTIVSSIERSRQFQRIIHSVITFMQMPKITFIVGYVCFAVLGLPLPFNLSAILALEICLLLPTICLSFNNLKHTDSIIRKSNNIYSKQMFDCGLIHQIGIIELAAASFSYFVIMSVYGFWPSHLLTMRDRWYMRSINDLSDSYGQEWTYAQRRQLDTSAAALVLFTMVVLQLTASVTATWTASIITKKLPSLTFITSVILSVIVTVALINLGAWLQFLDLTMLRWSTYLTVLPFFIYLICFTEVRKYLYSKFNNSQWL